MRNVLLGIYIEWREPVFPVFASIAVPMFDQ